MQGCDTVFHLAALIAIPFSYRSPDCYVATNIQGTLNVVQAARALGIRRILHTSTSEVYGTARYVPIDEDHPLQGQSPYSASKIGADQIALSFHRSFALPLVVVRPFNTYGPRQSARAVIPTIITQLVAGQHRVKLGSLHPTRDYSFVRDTVSGFLALAECDAAIGEAVNLGSGFEISVGDLAVSIAEAIGRGIEIDTEQERQRPAASEVDRLWAGTGKMQRLTGWQPEHSGLDGFRRGLARTIEWFSAPENRAAYKHDIYNV
jgi:NAD dependent epimerase/dehydratase